MNKIFLIILVIIFTALSSYAQDYCDSNKPNWLCTDEPAECLPMLRFEGAFGEGPVFINPKTILSFKWVTAKMGYDDFVIAAHGIVMTRAGSYTVKELKATKTTSCRELLDNPWEGSQCEQ